MLRFMNATPSHIPVVGLERRRDFRTPCLIAVRFAEVNGKPVRPLHIAKSKNVSRGGMKITAMAPLERKSIALLDFDLNAIREHVNVEELLMISSQRILAEVVWRKLDLQTGLFESGLRFVPQARHRELRSVIRRALQLT